MISADYVQMMARYNAWQNTWMTAAARTLDAEALRMERGAFFGSIFGTLNHILWADRMWMSRFDGGAGPDCEAADNTRLHPTFDSWAADRIRTDGRIKLWAGAVRPAQLRGDLTWRSALKEQEMSLPFAQCVMHFFNHQTHHRGQVHAMLTQAGVKTDTTDLVFLP